MKNAILKLLENRLACIQKGVLRAWAPLWYLLGWNQRHHVKAAQQLSARVVAGGQPSSPRDTPATWIAPVQWAVLASSCRRHQLQLDGR